MQTGKTGLGLVSVPSKWRHPEAPRSYQRGEGSRTASFCALITARSAPARTVDELAGNRGLGHAPRPNIGFAVHLGGDHPRHRAPALHFDFQPQLIAGAYGTAEFRALDSREHHDFVGAI